MTRGILVAGNEGPTVQALAAEAKKRVQSAVFAFPPALFGFSEPTEEPIKAHAGAFSDGDSVLPWNPASALSARALTIGAENRLGQIDEAILVCAPPAVRRRPDELPPAKLDAFIDSWLKGWFFLSRELTIAFRARKSGTLALVLSEVGLSTQKDEAPDLIGGVVAAAFQAFAQGLLAASFQEPYRVLAFSQADSPDDTGFSAFVFRVLDEANKRNSGRWHKYGRGLFSFR